MTHASKNWPKFLAVINARAEKVISAEEQALVTRGKVNVTELKLCVLNFVVVLQSCAV